MKKVALALLVVLTVSSVSFAGYVPFATLASTDGSLDVWHVGFTTDPALGGSEVTDLMDVVYAFRNIAVAGGYNQRPYGGYGPACMTPLNLVELTAPDGTQNTFLYDADTRLLDVTQYSAERDNPANFDEDPNNDVATWLIPSGTWLDDQPQGPGAVSNITPSGNPTYAIAGPDGLLQEIYFLQVVLPADGASTALVTGTYQSKNLAANSVFEPFSIIVGVPEPSTIVMLVLGALCLLGIRRK